MEARVYKEGTEEVDFQEKVEFQEELGLMGLDYRSSYDMFYVVKTS